MTSFISKPQLQDSIAATRMRISRTRDKMKALRNTLVLKDLGTLPPELDEYSDLNEELRRAKIFEAELVYLRNQL